jgi:parvulin-like peptidyl-prolyl isomerase
MASPSTRTLATLALLGSLSALGDARPATQSPATARVVARIDGVDVERRAYEDWLLLERGEVMAPALVEEVVLERMASELGAAVDPSAVAAQLDDEIATRVENAFGGDAAAWVAELQLSRSTEAGYRNQRGREIRLDLLGKEITRVGRVVPDSKVVREWESSHGPNGVRARVRALFLSIELVTPEGGWPVEERRAALERAQAQATERMTELLDRVHDGSASFSDLAFEHSDDPSAESGGMLDGSFDGVGWPSSIVDAVTSAPEGELTEPLVGRGGVWAFQVVTRRETPLDEVRDEIVARLIERGPDNDEVAERVGPAVSGASFAVSQALVGGDLSDRSALGVTIGDRALSLDEYGGWLRRVIGEQMLPRYAERLAIESQGRELGYAPSAEEIEQRIDENLAITIELQYGGDYAAWESSLAGNRRDLESWRREARRRVRAELIAEALIKRDRTTSEEEVRSLWIDRYGRDGVLIEVRMIAKLSERPEPLPEESRRAWQRRVQDADRATLDALGALATRIDDGEDFAALAERYSDDRESAILGGRLPGGFHPDEWSEAVRTAMAEVRAGMLVGPLLEGDRGVLFEVTGRREVPFEQVRDELREELDRRRVSVVDLAAFRNVILRDVRTEALSAMFD